MGLTRSHNRNVFPLSASLLFCALVNAQNPDPPFHERIFDLATIASRRRVIRSCISSTARMRTTQSGIAWVV